MEGLHGKPNTQAIIAYYYKQIRIGREELLYIKRNIHVRVCCKPKEEK